MLSVVLGLSPLVTLGAVAWWAQTRGGGKLEIVNMVGEAPASKRTRRTKPVDAVVLHQMGVSRGNDVRRYLKVTVHFVHRRGCKGTRVVNLGEVESNSWPNDAAKCFQNTCHLAGYSLPNGRVPPGGRVVAEVERTTKADCGIQEIIMEAMALFALTLLVFVWLLRRE